MGISGNLWCLVFRSYESEYLTPSKGAKEAT